VVPASGWPTPRRRTLAAGIPALRSLGIGRRFAILAPLANDAGSRGVGNPSLVARRGAGEVPASGWPTPRRRTFAAGIPALRSLGIGRRFAILAPLANDAGSRGVGNPSLVTRRGARVAPWKPNGVSRGTGVAIRVARWAR